ncbi:histidine kinase [Novosphingobium mangrovi (ex Huang et al. 2023)]|uniref:Histidine kinase n=1 Tax=Novosphingobium mangrovi (ex Huang et al. 2023) TaxID=2976432 RepID=A0ABT2I9M6_9SPHN|nr:histidine kinase [Novosphingobium mangrovi (ex Huang et al. 2023)]MCT2401529.1 histidine kinase [Novosphingobium mangrovi (ex Huang et al. 2023)]
MRPRSVPIKSLLLRTFLPAVVLVAVLLAGLAYNWLYASILDGFERKLVTASALTGAMVDPADHDRLIRAAMAGEDAGAVEATPAYRRNVVPLRHIREQLGLTYLYTQVTGGPEDILYILDGTVGEDHSLIGSTDDLPDETVEGLDRVEKQGTIYVSPIEYQEQWGLLKTAAAPVMGADGRIAASAGADVNISVIQVATQNALFMSAMIGIGSVLACILVTLALVRRIAVPIEALTEDTLQIAAGGTHGSAGERGPREVMDLRRALADRVGQMAGDAKRRKDAIAEREARGTADLLAGQAGAGANLPVVLVSRADCMVAWVAARDMDVGTILASRAMAQLACKCASNPDLAKQWRRMADFDHGTCVVVDGGAGTVELVGAEQRDLLIGGRQVRLEPGMRARFEAGESITLAGQGRPDCRLWPEAAR